MSRPRTSIVSTQSPLSRLAGRTRGQSHGPITRLMSPSDFGRLLKPFVFLDLIDNQGKPFSGFGLHPHSGIATLDEPVPYAIAVTLEVGPDVQIDIYQQINSRIRPVVGIQARP